MTLHHPIRFYLIFMFAILYSMTSSAYGANVISLNSIGGIGNKVIVTMSMDNEVALAGIQFTIRDTPDSLSLISITKTSRLSGFSTPPFNDLTDLGVATIVGFTIGGPYIAAGSGDILILTYEISPNTPPGDITLTFDKIVLSTPDAVTLGATGVPDVITVLDPVALIPHPAGQSTNKFDQTAQAIDQDLFRFGIMNSACSLKKC